MRKQYFDAISSKAKLIQSLEEVRLLLNDNDELFQSTVLKAKILYDKVLII